LEKWRPSIKLDFIALFYLFYSRAILREKIDECDYGTSPVAVFGKLTLCNGNGGVLGNVYHDPEMDPSSPPRPFAYCDFDSTGRHNHNRNRSLDSFMSTPPSMDSYQFALDPHQSQDEEQEGSGIFKHRRQSSNFSNTSSASPRMSSNYCRHHFINGHQQDFGSSTKAVVVKCPFCHYPGPGGPHSDDSGVCSASASTVSGASGIPNGSLSESEDFPPDGVSPRLSFDSNSLNEEDPEDLDEERVKNWCGGASAASQLQFLNEDEEEEVTDGEATLVSSLVSDLDVDVVDSGVSMEMDSAVLEEPFPGENFLINSINSSEPKPTKSNSSEQQTSIFNRFRNSSGIGIKSSPLPITPSPQSAKSPPTVGHTVTSGMRSVLKLNLKGRTKKVGSSSTPPPAETNKPPTPGCHTGIGIWTSVTRAANCKLSKDTPNINNNVELCDGIGGDVRDSPCSTSLLPLPHQQYPHDESEISPRESNEGRGDHVVVQERGHSADGSGSKGTSSWLLRLFESQIFNMSYAIGYLFTSKEPGVQQYIGKHTMCQKLFRIYV